MRIVQTFVRGHARRYVAAGLAVVLGVAFVAASLIVLSSAKNSLTDAVAAQYDRASLVVTGHSLEITDAERLERVSGVAAAAPNGATELSFQMPDESAQRLTMAVAPNDPELRWHQLDSGRFPAAADEIVLATDTAAQYDIAAGETVRVSGENGRMQAATVVGLLDSDMAASDLQGLATSGLSQSSDELAVSEILVRARADADTAALADRIERAVDSDGARVVTGEQRTDERLTSLTRGVDVYGTVLFGFAAVAGFVAVLVVANTFTVLLAQRTRQLALLRCVGAGRGQLFRAVLVESGLLGVVASAAGLVVGHGFAAAALALLQVTGVGFPGASVQVALSSVLLPGLVGVVLTVAASLVPAWRATKVAPLAALRPDTVGETSRVGIIRLVSALILVAAGTVALVLGLSGAQGAEILIGVAGGASALVGVLLAGPLLVPLIIRLLGLATGRLGGQRRGLLSRVAVRNLVRHPRRAAVTTSALLVGVTLLTTLAVGAASVRDTLYAELDLRYPVDITVAGPDGDPLHPTTREAMDDVAGLSAQAELSSGTVTVDGTERSAVGVAPQELGRVVRETTIADDFGPGVVLLHPDNAEALGVAAGDQLRLSGEDAATTMQVQLATISGAGGELVLAEGDLTELGPSEPGAVIWARIADAASATDVVRDVEAAVARPGPAEGGGDGAGASDPGEVLVSGGAPERVSYDQIIQPMLWVAVGLLGISVVIALVGIGNTLSLSVLERTRENALLRALGLTRTQLRRLVATEAGLMAGAAVVIGIPLGLVFGFAGTAWLLGEVAEGGLVPAVPVVQLAGVVVVTLAAGVAASLLPGHRAARVAPSTALAHE